MKVVKITASTDAAPQPRRWYQDACGTAHALELVGERWSLMILRELMFGPRRFSDIRASLPGLSANVLTQRLGTLEAHGLLARTTLPPPASVQVYGLTEWGYQADRLLMVMGEWAARSPGHDPTLPLSGASLMLSFRTMFRAEHAASLRMTAGFRLGRETFRVRIDAGNLVPQRGAAGEADVVFTATPEAMAAFVHGKLPLDEMLASGAVVLQGNRDKALLFQTLFELPPKAPMSSTQSPAPRPSLPQG